MGLLDKCGFIPSVGTQKCKAHIVTNGAKICDYNKALEWINKRKVFTEKELKDNISDDIIEGLKLTGMIRRSV
jgi:hypothetical protein